MPTLLVEAAVETLAGAQQAVRSGAHRLELCADLSVGGLTPDMRLLRAVKAAVAVPVHVLIRPRAGGFVYGAAERESMGASIVEACQAGADALVVGALTRDGTVDGAVIEALRLAAGPTPLVGHRAVDAARDVTEAVEAMAAFGVRRVLTSGGAPTAEQGALRLAELVRRFGGRLTILAGGSIRSAHVRRLVALSRVREVHVGFPESAEADRVRALVAALKSRPASARSFDP